MRWCAANALIRVEMFGERLIPMNKPRRPYFLCFQRQCLPKELVEETMIHGIQTSQLTMRMRMELTF